VKEGGFLCGGGGDSAVRVDDVGSARGRGGARGVEGVFRCFPNVAAREGGDVLPPVHPFFSTNSAVIRVLRRAHHGPARVSRVILDYCTVHAVVCGAED
jgi:hypothetical protein